MMIKLKDIKFLRNIIILNISVKAKLPTTQANILTISIFQHSDSHYQNFKMVDYFGHQNFLSLSHNLRFFPLSFHLTVHKYDSFNLNPWNSSLPSSQTKADGRDNALHCSAKVEKLQ